MKRTFLKINKYLKAAMLAATLFVGGKLIAVNPSNVKYALVPLSIVGTMKKKGVTLEADEEKAFEAMDAAISEWAKNFTTEEQLTEKLKGLKLGMTDDQVKKFEEVEETLEKQAILLDQLKSMGNPAQPVDNSLVGQLKAWMAANPEAIKNFKEKKTQGFEIELKAAGNITVAASQAANANSAVFPAPQFLPGVQRLQRNQPYLAQYMNGSGATSPNIWYAEIDTAEGEAGWTAEGGTYSQIDLKIRTAQSTAKKITDYIVVSREMLDDVDYIASEIENELLYKISIKLDTDLLSGDGTGDSIKGLLEYIGGYVLTTVLTDEPNNMDAILAAVTQVATLNFMASHAFVNPIDFANMNLTKGANGHYLIPPFKSANGMEIAGVTVVQSNQVPVGNVLVGDMSRTNLHPYKSFTLNYGYVNDGLIKGMVTITGELRLHHFVKKNNIGAFVYDSFANIKAAIANPTI